MADIEITDEASLQAWLRTRPRRDAEIIAFRAAARVFPLWGRAMEEEWAKKSNLNAMPILRSLWMSLAQTKIDDPNWIDLHIAAIEAHKVAGEYSDIALDNFDFAAGHAASASEFSTEIEIAPIASELSSIMEKLPEASNGWRQIGYDCVALLSGSRHLPLWPTPAPDWFTKADFETRAIWAKDPDTWAFWEKWWDGVISGDMPFSPDLLRDVALIDDDIWQAGPKAVAGAIAQIEKIHDLRAQLAALTKAMDEEDLTQVQRDATHAHRGHNNPPELIEAMAIVQASAVEIAQGLDDARAELAKPAPDPSRLKAIGTWMLTAIMKTAGYCGGLVDKFLQEFAGEMGKQAATVVAWLIKGGIGVSLLTAFAKSMIAVWPF